MAVIHFVILLLFVIKENMVYGQCNYNTCFECVGTQNCQWSSFTTPSCKSGIDQNYFDKWPLKFDICNDASSVQLTKKHCKPLSNWNPPINLALQKTNGQYSDKGLFCKFSITVSDNKRVNVFFTRPRNSNMQNDKFLINYKYNDYAELSLNIILTEYKLYSIYVKRIDLYYFSRNGPYGDLPFNFVVEYRNGFNYSILISIIISMLVAVIIGVSIFFIVRCCQRNKALKKKHAVAMAGNSVSGEMQHKMMMNRMMIQQAFPIMCYYNPNFSYPTSCALCKLTFIPNVSVNYLKCLHMFHDQCFKNYCEKHIMNTVIMCPCCNTELISFPNNDIQQVNLVANGRNYEGANMYEYNPINDLPSPNVIQGGYQNVQQLTLNQNPQGYGGHQIPPANNNQQNPQGYDSHQILQAYDNQQNPQGFDRNQILQGNNNNKHQGNDSHPIPPVNNNQQNPQGYDSHQANK